MKTIRNAALAVALLTVATAPTVLAADDKRDRPDELRQDPRPVAERSEPVTPFVFEGDVRTLPVPKRWQPGDPVREIPRRKYVEPGAFVPDASNQGLDRLHALQQAAERGLGDSTFTVPDRNFPGEDFTGVNPPDTVGDVGPNHYIQMINNSSSSLVTIFDKALPEPNVLASFLLEDLATSGPCTSGRGDPIVLYDRFADRWLLTEFTNGGNTLCFFVSQTPDPVAGGWNVYSFDTPQFPDYPKYGVWPTDANGGLGSYIATTNESGCGVYAMDRANMLAGNPATFQRFLISDLPGFPFNAVTPADLDGPNPPPTGAPAVIMRQRDTEAHSGPDAPEDVLEMWHFDVDWVNTANTTFTRFPDLDVAEFESDLCGLSAFACFEQPGTGTTLDPLREVIMNRLQYQNFGDHETLVGNFVTDVDGTDRGGLRWFELRRPTPADPWSLHQEGTYSPDTDSRWMAASAMDQSGNIAIAYNVSSSTTFPSLRYTGRLADDPLGTMSQPETSIDEGTASNSSNRYGDYSGMNLDPADDCTFWFTGENNRSSSWRTQIASFRFDACGCELEPLPLTLSGGPGGDNEVDLAWNDSELTTVVEYRIRRSRTPGGPYTTIDTVADTSPGSGNGAGYAYTDTTVSGGITYYYVVQASDGEACTSDASNEIAAPATGSCTLAPLFAGLVSVDTPFSGICTLNLSWQPGTAECGGPLSYNVYRGQDPDFVPGPGNRVAEDIGSQAYTDLNSLVTDTTYWYVVRAVDTANGVEEPNTVRVSGFPQGQLTTGTFLDDGGDTGLAQMTADAPWTLSPTEGDSGPAVYKTGNYGNNTCAGLTTPELVIGASSVLTFRSQYEIESGWDKGEVQISVDGGQSWTRLEVNYPGTSNRQSDACGFPTGEFFTGTDLTYATYTADLSAFAGASAFIRFQMSSDTTQTRDGWWVDEISITDTGVPGTCATGSSCEENPNVNVTPDGPLVACSLDDVELSADLTNGTGPYSYQWYRDGLDIPGATDATYMTDDVGVYSYNVRVSADACDDSVFDGIDTVIDTRDRPVFAGLESAVNPQNATCTVDLDWSAASTACAGPLTYSIYRAEGTSVAPTPANLLVSGVSGTSYSDASGLANNTDYAYVVRAYDAATGTDDGNAVSLSARPDGPGTGIQTAYEETFESAATFADWTVTTGPGPHSCGEWDLATSLDQQPAGGSGNYALALSEACTQLLPRTSTTLTSPPIDLDLPGLQGVELQYDIFYRYLNGDDASVEVWDGSGWVVLWEDQDADYDVSESIDITALAAGVSDFRIRFDYQNANNDKWFAVDNVRVVTDIVNPCTTAAAGPPEAPDGRNGTQPLRGGRLDPAGSSIRVTWDTATCTASGYNLLYGDLSGVASSALDGSVCGVGTAGTFDWSGVPGGDLFFLVVGNDGAGTESSWGVTSGNVERNGLTGSGECGTVNKDTTGTCP